jgi:phospholipase/carboxylesterase
MTATDSNSLIHKILEPRETGIEKSPVIILLHGRGTDENDLLGLAPYLDPRLYIVSLRAPFPFQWGPGYVWYDIIEVGYPDEEKYPVSLNKIIRFIEGIGENLPIDTKQIFLFGFSMGAVMANTVALSHPDLIKAVGAHSGYIAEGDMVQYKWQESKETQFFIGHGVSDSVIQIRFGKRAHELLSQHDIPHTYKEYPIGHQISNESLGDFTTWISGLISR